MSIGLPVRNGEEFLAEALDSLLAQSFEHFELLICDNASSDETEEICRTYASRDRRVRYRRNARNVGMAENFNLAFRSSKSPYFKWAAHDDTCAVDFLARCVEALDRSKEVVLAYPRTSIIDGRSGKIEQYGEGLSWDSASPADRFRASLQNSKCFEIFGLIRRAALAKTPLFGSYAHTDGVLLARLALMGRFERVPEDLLHIRRHPGQSTHLWVDYRRYAVMIDPKLAGKMLFPGWRLQYEYLRSISMFPLSWSERVRCFGHLARHAFSRRGQLRGDVTFWLWKRAPWTRAAYCRLKGIFRAH